MTGDKKIVIQAIIFGFLASVIISIILGFARGLLFSLFMGDGSLLSSYNQKAVYILQVLGITIFLATNAVSAVIAIWWYRRQSTKKIGI